MRQAYRLRYNGGMSIHPFIICGFRKSGKTTLIEMLLRELSSRGIMTGTMKRSAHSLAHNPTLTDTEKHHAAGARRVIGYFPDAEVTIESKPDEISLENRLSSFDDCDLVLLEGFKDAPCPKLFLVGPHGERPENIEDPWLRGAAGFDVEIPGWVSERNLPWFVIDRREDVLDLVELILSETIKGV